nr:MAG TPA: hypothetical protein [Caudoviricetes sp.]
MVRFQRQRQSPHKKKLGDWFGNSIPIEYNRNERHEEKTLHLSF